MRMLCLLWLAAAMTGCSAPTLMLAPPSFRVHGQPVHFEERLNLRGNAGAHWFAGVPTIYWHSERFPELPNDMQWWTIGHELAHLNDPEMSESAADCEGIRFLKRLGALNDVTVTRIIETIETYHASEVHPDGALRAINIIACSTGLDLLARKVVEDLTPGGGGP